MRRTIAAVARVALILVPLSVLGVAAVPASAAPAAPAAIHAVQAVKTPHGGTCVTGSSCFWPQINNGGSADVFPNNGSNGFWWYVVTPLGYTPKSALMYGGSTLWLYEKSTGDSYCLPQDSGISNTHSKYGYVYIEYGIPNGCGSIPTPLP